MRFFEHFLNGDLGIEPAEFDPVQSGHHQPERKRLPRRVPALSKLRATPSAGP